jgi:hypothetical protein
MRRVYSGPRESDVIERVFLHDEDALALLRCDGEPWRFDHYCRILHYDDGAQTQLRCAPLLSAAHVVTRAKDDTLTVSRSIECPDCELHGYVEKSRWRHAD